MARHRLLAQTDVAKLVDIRCQGALDGAISSCVIACGASAAELSDSVTRIKKQQLKVKGWPFTGDVSSCH